VLPIYARLLVLALENDVPDLSRAIALELARRIEKADDVTFSCIKAIYRLPRDSVHVKPAKKVIETICWNWLNVSTVSSQRELIHRLERVPELACCMLERKSTHGYSHPKVTLQCPFCGARQHLIEFRPSTSRCESCNHKIDTELFDFQAVLKEAN